MAKRSALAVCLAIALVASACSGEGSGPVEQVNIPRGAHFAHVTDSLAAKEIIRAPLLFRVYARITGADRSIKPGVYGFRKGMGWKTVLDDLQAGNILVMRVAIPEGWDLRRIAPRLAEVTGTSADSILEALADTAAATRYGVPGPTLEGYLYPATYSVPLGSSLDAIIETMVRQYKRIWTPERKARADSMNLTEREVITLASIVEKEAKVSDEMPIIAAVYHNRLRIGYPLQADPTVQYALGEHQRRLLYAHIDSVAAHPYNTYRRRGLPPGPIASPSVRAVDATLNPADVKYLYFVARPDGSHIFTRSLEEHNRARAMLRRQRMEMEAQRAGMTGNTP